MIVPRYYENLNVLHENTMPARAYYILMRFRFRVYGRWQDMIHISIQTSGIRFHLIHHMCRRIFRVEPMYIILSTVEMRKHQKLF